MSSVMAVFDKRVSMWLVALSALAGCLLVSEPALRQIGFVLVPVLGAVVVVLAVRAAAAGLIVVRERSAEFADLVDEIAAL